ncbi:hypothetical protein HaLaN_11050 [Haematococcus lacustris]|uniref:Uncharacterized protein n=1 Tax=Haematococcus lacustris TaxID=44745 RepID=A0A699YXD0_HAELA|nr:hypothetical protein HaLaN_11050 [Haematococcus lacustris]
MERRRQQPSLQGPGVGAAAAPLSRPPSTAQGPPPALATWLASAAPRPVISAGAVLEGGRGQGWGIFSGVPGPDFDLPEGSDILLAAPLDLTLLAAHSGPDEGIRNIAACAPAYDAAPATGTRNGNPIADCFGITAYNSGSDS